MSAPVRWSKGMYGCPVAMREDRVTAEDVEVVAERMAGEALARTHLTWDGLDDIGKDLWRHNAAQTLAAIFSAPAPPLFDFDAARESKQP
jgi:hypothetical protein